MKFTCIVSIHIIPEGSKTLFCDLLDDFWEKSWYIQMTLFSVPVYGKSI